jgi:hypothetical protein
MMSFSDLLRCKAARCCVSAELFLVPWCCWPDFLCPFQIRKSFKIEILGIFSLKKLKVFFGDAAAKE